MGGSFFGNSSEHVRTHNVLFVVSLALVDLGFIIVNVGSEGVYLDENCFTNPSRYLPGPKTTIKT